MRARNLPVAALLVLFSLPLVACNDSEDEPSKIVTTSHQREMPAWLSPKDKIDPAVWLRSREIGHEVLASDPEVDRIRRALRQAEIRFYEDPRMIVNRTEQTARMLADAGQRERDVDIMTGMIDIADVSRFKKLYGQLCQQYLNLRKNGQDRSAAIAQLGAAYKAAGGAQLPNATPAAASPAAAASPSRP